MTAFTLEGKLTRKPHALVTLPSGHFLRLGVPGEKISVETSVSYNDQSVRRDAPVRYVSSNPSVASVDAHTGAVYAIGKGLATITAVYTEGDVSVEDGFPVCVQ
ncbi:MAG: Ig-like domain-containing protein [Kiritimatiellia bacterium]